MQALIEVRAEKVAKLSARMIRIIQNIREKEWEKRLQNIRENGRRFMLFWSKMDLRPDREIKADINQNMPLLSPDREYRHQFELAEKLHELGTKLPDDTPISLEADVVLFLIQGIPCSPDLLK